jgi:type VI secretion system protein ImpC
MIEGIVAPHLAPKPDARRTELAGQVTETINLAMRVLLHHPAFQDLEAAWRSVDFLLRRLETAAGVEISIIDLSKQELLADVGSADPRSTGLYRLLVDEAGGTAGETPWAVVAGLYTFEPRTVDIRALGAIASIAQDAGAPFLASISPRLLGCESFSTQPDPEDWTARLDNEAELEWNKLRQLPAARWIGLALPRFVIRQPYGKNSVDLPDFEEMTVPPDAADHLWANPAIACVSLIAESFLADGWEVPLRNTVITGLPVHTYKVDGESQMTPCAECWMGERLAERFLDRGIMPLASMKGRDAVKLIRLQSIATPVSRLGARWG